MFKTIVDCSRPNYSTRKSPRRTPLFLLLLWISAYSPNARLLSQSSLESPPQQQNTIDRKAREAITLELGKPFETEILGGQTQSYHISASANQFICLTIQQRGIDVDERLFAPDGKLVAQFDSELRAQELERVEFVAERAGVYRIEVKAKIKGGAGRYEIRLVETRTATETDSLLHEAHKRSTE